ncbi:hypothetical protein [Nocardioides donggukensis]|uniref:Uncharacterized protein n=1 Tax=Nocardioides donggukensis TaxID=2774019 RepID=A0A927Q2N6_9ACTN|nr:hypothetical protein [Nocardioides donggukensis]MBD8869821.1 hypothetical protein [Nocardioides donggukensis]
MNGRLLLGGLGAGVAAYGAVLLLGQDLADLLDIAVWLTVGVLVHDAVLAPLTIVSGLLVARWVPGPLRAPLATGFLVLGATTLLAVPVLGRFGARPDNPTLLDRDYLTGWVVLAALTALGVAAATGLRVVARRSRGPRAGG